MPLLIHSPLFIYCLGVARSLCLHSLRKTLCNLNTNMWAICKHIFEDVLWLFIYPCHIVCATHEQTLAAFSFIPHRHFFQCCWEFVTGKRDADCNVWSTNVGTEPKVTLNSSCPSTVSSSVRGSDSWLYLLPFHPDRGYSFTSNFSVEKSTRLPLSGKTQFWKVL